MFLLVCWVSVFGLIKISDLQVKKLGAFVAANIRLIAVITESWCRRSAISCGDIFLKGRGGCTGV